jgi:O-antigen ligase
VVKNKKINRKDKKSNSVWFLLIGVAFTNLYFDINSIDPFNTPKLITVMVIAGWLAGHLISALYRNRFYNKGLEFYSVFISALLIVSILISTLKSDNLFRAFIGDTQRRNGFLSYLSLIIIFIFCVHIMNFVYIIRLYKIAIINGFLFSGYGLIQISGNDFVSWNNPYNAIISTVGNPNFASAIMSVFLVIGLASLRIKELNSQFKILAVMMSFMCITGIVLSNSRQGLVSAGFALVFYLVIWIYSNSKKLGILSIFAMLVAGILSILGMLQVGPLTSYLYKTSVTIRGYYWDAGLQMFKNNILTGVGIDSYGMYFKEYRSAEYPLKYGFEITSSNAHNVFIQFLSTAGIFTSTLYILLIIFILINGLILLKKSNSSERVVSLGIVSSWIAFQAQSIISIDNIGISIWGWLLGGAILGLRKAQINSLFETETSRELKKLPVIDPVQPLISGLFLIPIIFLSFNLNRVETEMAVVKSFTGNISEIQKVDLNQKISQLVESSLTDPYYKLDAIFSLYNLGYTEESFNLLYKLSREDKRNNELKGFLADLEESRNNFSKSIDLRQEFAILDPWNAKNYLALIRLCKKNGNNDLAQFYLNKLLEFAPLTDEVKAAEEVIEN